MLLDGKRLQLFLFVWLLVLLLLLMMMMFFVFSYYLVSILSSLMASAGGARFSVR